MVNLTELGLRLLVSDAWVKQIVYSITNLQAIIIQDQDLSISLPLHPPHLIWHTTIWQNLNQNYLVVAMVKQVVDGSDTHLHTNLNSHFDLWNILEYIYKI